MALVNRNRDDIDFLLQVLSENIDLIQIQSLRIDALEALHATQSRIEFRHTEGSSTAIEVTANILESMGEIDAQYVMVEQTGAGSVCFQAGQAASLLASEGPVDSEFIPADHHFRVAGGVWQPTSGVFVRINKEATAETIYFAIFDDYLPNTLGYFAENGEDNFSPSLVLVVGHTRQETCGF